MKHKRNYNEKEQSRVKLYKTHQGWMSSLTCLTELFSLSSKKENKSVKSGKSYFKGVGALATVVGAMTLGAAVVTPTAVHADADGISSTSQVVASEAPASSTSSVPDNETPSITNNSSNNNSISSSSNIDTNINSDSASNSLSQADLSTDTNAQASTNGTSSSNTQNLKADNQEASFVSLLATDEGVNVSTAQEFYNQVVSGTASVVNLTNDIDLGAAYGSQTGVMSTPHSVTINGNGHSINFGNFHINPNWTSPTNELNITFNDTKLYTANQYGAIFMNTPKLFSNPKIRLVYNNVEAIGGTAVFADTTANNGIGNQYTGQPLKTFEIKGNTTITGVNSYIFNGQTYNTTFYDIHGTSLISPAFNVIIDNNANVVLDAGGNAYYNIQLQGNIGTHTITIGENAKVAMKGATYSNIYMPSYNNGDNVISIGKNAEVSMQVGDSATDNIDFNYHNASVNNTININPGAKVTLNGPSNFSAYGTVTVNINTPSYVYLTNGGGKAYAGSATYTVNASRTSIITVDGAQKFASPLVETNTATIKGSSVKSTNTVLMPNQTGTVEDVATINNNIVQPRFETTIYMGCMADLYNPQGGAMWTWSDDWNAMSNLSSAGGVDIKNTSLSFRNGFLKSGNDIDSIYQIINGTKYAGTSKVSWNLTGFVTGLQTANVTITYPDGSTDTTTMQVLVLQEPSFIRYNQVRPDESGKTNTITATDLLGNLSSDSSAIGQPIGAEWANGTGPQITSTTQVGRYNGNDAYINVQYNDDGLSLVGWPKDGKFRKKVQTIFVTTNLQTTVSNGVNGTAAFTQDTKTKQLVGATVYSAQNEPVEYIQQENGTLKSSDGSIYGVPTNTETITVPSTEDASKVALSSLVNLTSINPADYSLSWDKKPQVENNQLRGMVRAQFSPALFFSIPVTADIKVEGSTTPTTPTDPDKTTPDTSLPDNSKHDSGNPTPVEPVQPSDNNSGNTNSSKDNGQTDPVDTPQPSTGTDTNKDESEHKGNEEKPVEPTQPEDNTSGKADSSNNDNQTNQSDDTVQPGKSTDTNQDDSTQNGNVVTPEEPAQNNHSEIEVSTKNDKVSNKVEFPVVNVQDEQKSAIVHNETLENQSNTVSDSRQSSELGQKTHQTVDQSSTDSKNELPQTGNDTMKGQILALTGLSMMFGLVGMKKKRN